MDTDVVSFTRTFLDVTVVRQTPKEYVASVVLDELQQQRVKKLSRHGKNIGSGMCFVKSRCKLLSVWGR